MHAAGQKVKEAGILLSVTAISGLGGTTRWREHAEQTGRALSRMHPDYIGLLTLMLEQGTPLYEQWMAGNFDLLTPEEVMQETLVVLENLDSEGSVFRMNHASNYLTLRGTLNTDREAMMQKLRKGLEGSIRLRSESSRLL